MVHGTRSRSRIGGDDNSSKNHLADREGTSPGSRKTDCLGFRRLARETSSKDTRTSPSPTRKSERIQKKTSPVTPVMCGKLDKLDTLSPLRRSDRGKRNVPSSPKIPEDESVSSGTKSHGKKEETVKQPMMESEKVSTSRKVHYKSLSSIGKKRKRINGHSNALLLKRRQRRGTLSGITKSKRLLQFPEVDSSESRNKESKLVEDEENGVNECHTKSTNELTNHLAPHFNDGASKDMLEACPGMETLKIPNLVYAASGSREINSESGEHEIIKSSKTDILNTELEVTVADANMQKSISASASEPLTGHEKHFFAGFCVSCSKHRRVGHDSPKVELCSCVTMHNKDNNYIASPEDGVGMEAILISGSAEKCHSRKSEGDFSDPYVDKNENVCIVCKDGGKSILCNGNGCKRCYHLPSSGRLINDAPLGVWHCLWCLKKKIAFGVHSVTKGVDSICDAREVIVSGTHRQKQYLVKYIDLAHVHNQWVSEAQLLLEAPFLVANFSDNNQVIGWNSEWTLPHRLLKKRLLSFSKSLGDCQNFDAGDNSECQYEWLVMWRGLDYENATWELEIADCLRSPHGQTLVREYEIRLEKAKQLTGKNNKQSLVELPKVWDGSSLISNMDMLNSMNKLHDHWCKSENVALYDDQEQMMKIGLFILSMSMVCCWPVLIITASHAISHWEAELKKWAPTVDCVVYQGSRETRRIIEMCEFYSQGGSIMLQVLLTSLETAVEDILSLNRLNWELVVFDQCQHFNLSSHVEKVDTLGGLKVILFNGPIKHTASEYSNMLSLVHSDGDLEKVDMLKTCSNDTLGQWKERAASQEFFEYWLPVQLSELQLELYCDTLLSNIDALCSYSKSDPVGALNDMLLNIRKCCDHPYIIFYPSTNSFNNELSQTNILDIGIQASGKLQLLDKMLSEMKCRQLRTIILFQSYVGTTPSIGNILEDFLSQRFGENSYELVDSFLARSKKESALIRFNSVENGRFIFLLENRACKPSIKLSSVDNVIIYSSDTNPSNDLRLLEKLSFHSATKEIKVFRLYSCFTVEEQALVIAKKEPDHSHSLNRNLNDTLRWGAADLFCRLDEYNANESHLSSGQLLLSVALKEFRDIISDIPEKAGISASLIAKVPHSSSQFTPNLSLFGEQKVNCTGEEPCVFWKSLLGVRNPQWRHIRCRSPRSRKRGQFFGKSDQTPELAGNVVKKYKTMNSERGQISASEEGPSAISSSNVPLPASTNGNNGLTVMHPSSSLCGITREEPAEIMTLSDKQSSLHILLKTEMEKVFEVLKLPDDVKKMAAQFLEYVIENHRISRERVMAVNIFQAFQISMCWMAGKLLKQKVDKDEMLELTKERLKFKCTKEEATAVYQRFRALKKLFLQNMKRNEQAGNVSEHCEADKKGDTCKNMVQPPLEEHITDEILLVEQPKDFRVGYNHPAEVQENALNVVVGFENDVEANTVNKYNMTNIGGNLKDVASNCDDVNQTSDKVASSDDGGLLHQNQCSRAHSSENQGTSHIEAGVAGPFIATRHEMSNSEAVVAENCEHQHATNANDHSIHGEVAYVSCDQEDYDLQTSRPSQSVETGTPTQASHDGGSRDPLHNELDRIRGEMAHAAKHQEDLRTQLKSDCEKEIEETVAEIRNRYNARLQESETKYSLRKSELGGNMKKVLLNKLLADTFRTKCEEDLSPSRIVTMFQAILTSFRQHLNQVSVQPTLQSAYLTGFSSPGWQTSAPARVRPPTIASPSAGEQTSISEITRVPSHSMPSGGQESATAPSVVASPRRPPPSIYLPPARQQNLSTVQSRSPSIASSSAGEQTPASATTEPPSFSLCPGGQQLATSQPTLFKSATVVESSRRPSPFSISLPPASQQNSSMVWTRSPQNASPSTGEQTSAPAITRPPSFSVSSGGQQLATSQPTLSKSATVDESPRRPTPPPTAFSFSGQRLSATSQQTSATSMSCVSGESLSPPPPPRSIALPQASSQQSSSAVWSQSPSIALSLGGQPVASQQTPVSSRSSMFGKSSRTSYKPPVIGSITPSSGNLRRGDIRAPAPHLQSFKPSRFSLAPNFSPSDPPSLNHAPPLPSADSSQNSLPKEHAEPNNRTSLHSVNVSATELLGNLEDSLGRLSVAQQNESGRQGFCTATNFLSPSSSTSSPNHSPSLTTNCESSRLSQDKEQQLQPPAETDYNNHVLKTAPFSELLRNLYNQACLNQSTNGLPSFPKANLGTEGSSVQEGSSSAPLSTDVVCLSNNEE